MTKHQIELSKASEIQIFKSLSLLSSPESYIFNETDIMTKHQVFKKLGKKSDALSSWVYAKSAIKMGQFQIELYLALQVQMKKFLILNWNPISLIFNTTNDMQKF